MTNEKLNWQTESKSEDNYSYYARNLEEDLEAAHAPFMPYILPSGSDSDIRKDADFKKDSGQTEKPLPVLPELKIDDKSKSKPEPEANKVDEARAEIDKRIPFDVDTLKAKSRYDTVFKEAKEIFQIKQALKELPSENELYEKAKAAAVPGQNYHMASVPYWVSKDGREAVGETYFWDKAGHLSKHYWRRGGGDQLGRGESTVVYHNREGIDSLGPDPGWINQSRNESLIARGGNPPVDIHGRSMSAGTSAGCQAHPSEKGFANWQNFKEKMHLAIKDNKERNLRPFASHHVGFEYAVRTSLHEDLSKFRPALPSEAELSKPKDNPKSSPVIPETKTPEAPFKLEDAKSWTGAQKRLVAASEAALSEKMWRYAGWSDGSVEGGNLGCAGAVSAVLKLAGYDGNLSAGANELGRILQREGGWQKKLEKSDLRKGDLKAGDIKPGDIIVWRPGESGHGHIAVVVPGKMPAESAKQNGVLDGLDCVHNSSGKRHTIKESLEARLRNDSRNWYIVRPPGELAKAPAPANPVRLVSYTEEKAPTENKKHKAIDQVQAKRIEGKFEQLLASLSNTNDDKKTLEPKPQTPADQEIIKTKPLPQLLLVQDKKTPADSKFKIASRNGELSSEFLKSILVKALAT